MEEGMLAKRLVLILMLMLSSAVISVLSGDSGQVALKCGLFDKIPMPVYKSFEEEEPAWLNYIKSKEENQ